MLVERPLWLFSQAARRVRVRLASTSSTSAPPRFDLFTPSEEHGALRAAVRGFAEREVGPQAQRHDRAEQFNEQLFHKLGDLGLLGITVEPALGGAGMDASAVVIAHEELAAQDPAFCLSFLAHSLLFAHNLSVNGSEAQKQRLLPAACSGRLLGGMGMSEPGSGTDVLGMATRAEAEAGGAGFLLTGTKMWITNGARSDSELGDAFLIYARSPQRVPAAATSPASAAVMDGDARYSLFLVEKGMTGFALGQRIKGKCGMRASNTAELVLDRVRVPAATHLVGEEGSALQCMMRNLEVERLALAAMSLGIARRCIEVMSAYAKQRRAFGEPLNRFGQIQRHIAESYAEYAAGRAYVYATARAMDLSRSGNRIDSDGVKLYCGPMASAVAGRAVQVLGGNGYIGAYDVERLWRDAKLLEIGGGTNESHQKNISKDLARGPEKLP